MSLIEFIEKYGEYLPDKAIEEAGGCRYCSMTGFEDYPISNKPCRRGHSPMSMPALFPIPEPTGPNSGKPTEGDWEWTGRGWKNLNYGVEK